MRINKYKLKKNTTLADVVSFGARDGGGWIKKGSKGIALITNDNGVQGLRHIFDISDTYDKFNRNVYVWQVEDDMQNEIIETLENRFGDLENKDNLADSIINSADVASGSPRTSKVVRRTR